MMAKNAKAMIMAITTNNSTKVKALWCAELNFMGFIGVFFPLKR
jgi:hypothetical protein